MRRPLSDVVTELVVRRRLAEAFETLRRLPSKKWPQGYRLAHGIGMAEEGKDRRQPDDPRPDALEIAEADEALAWLVHLRNEDEAVRRAVQLRASGLSLRQLAPRLGCSHVWAGRLEARGVAAIVAGLRQVDLLPGMSTWGKDAAGTGTAPGRTTGRSTASRRRVSVDKNAR